VVSLALRIVSAGDTFMDSDTVQSECELMTCELLSAVEKVIAKDVGAQQAEQIRDLCTTFVRRSPRTEKTRTGPVRQTSRLVGDKWTPLVVMVLNCGAMRYLALHNIVSLLARQGDESGISQRMLTLVLRNLEMNGMVARSAQSATAHRGEYFLTPLGKSFYDQIMQLVEWAERHSDELIRARANYTGPRLVVNNAHPANDDCVRSYGGHSSLTQSR
jgi:DNA-binding HxlR family transcriptional regulator